LSEDVDIDDDEEEEEEEDDDEDDEDEGELGLEYLNKEDLSVCLYSLHNSFGYEGAITMSPHILNFKYID